MKERSFTPLEINVLKIFFTGVSEDDLANVYCAKHTMPGPVWAFMTGSYSRSQLTMREKFLEVVNEVKPEDTSYDRFLADIADDAGDVLQALLARSEKFLSTWAVQYGHNSLKDSCVDRFAVEGVSITLTKMVEWAVLGAYQEKSTRYADFSDVDFVNWPFNQIEIRSKANQAFDKCLEAYKTVFNHAQQYFYDSSTVENLSVRSRTARASAFDIARYLLPVSTPTAMGITSPSRETERIITALISSPYAEAQAVGNDMLKASLEVNPSLLRHIAPSKYDVRVRPASEPCTELGDSAHSVSAMVEKVGDCSLEVSSPSHSQITEGVSMMCAPLEHPAHPMWLAAASVAKNIANMQISIPLLANSIMKTCFLEGDTHPVFALMDKAFDNRGPHDDAPIALDTGSLIFEGFIDFGAYRDVQRHRNGKQAFTPPTIEFGYEIPEYVAQHPELTSVYVEAVEEIEKVHKEIAANDSAASERGLTDYCTLLCHRVLFSYECTVRQAIYMIELRSGPAGHESYRKFAQGMAQCLIKEIPALENHIRVDWSEKTTRVKAEEATERKLVALQSANA